MTPTDIEEILQAHADEPMRITLSSGDHIDITHAGAVRIELMKVLVFPDLQPGRIAYNGRVRYLSAMNVAMIEPIRRVAPPSTN